MSHSGHPKRPMFADLQLERALKFSLLIYGSEAMFDRLPPEAQAEVVEMHKSLQNALRQRGAYLSVQLMSTNSAVTVAPATGRSGKPLVVDGPFSDSKEQFLGLYIAEFDGINDATEFAGIISTPLVKIEVRPVQWSNGSLD